MCESVDEMEEHTWVPWDPWGGSMDPLGGPMGPWDRWDLGLKDPRYFLRVVLSIPGPAQPGPACPPTIGGAGRLSRKISRSGPAARPENPVPAAGCQAGHFFEKRCSKMFHNIIFALIKE